MDKFDVTGMVMRYHVAYVNSPPNKLVDAVVATAFFVNSPHVPSKGTMSKNQLRKLLSGTEACIRAAHESLNAFLRKSGAEDTLLENFSYLLVNPADQLLGCSYFKKNKFETWLGDPRKLLAVKQLERFK